MVKEKKGFGFLKRLLVGSTVFALPFLASDLVAQSTTPAKTSQEDTKSLTDDGKIRMIFMPEDSAYTGINLGTQQLDSLFSYINDYPDLASITPAEDVPDIALRPYDILQATAEVPEEMGPNTAAQTYIGTRILVDIKGTPKQLIMTDAPWFLIQMIANAGDMSPGDIDKLKKEYDASSKGEYGKRFGWEYTYDGFGGHGAHVMIPIIGKQGRQAEKNTPVYVVAGFQLGANEKTSTTLLEPELIDESSTTDPFGNTWVSKTFDESTEKELLLPIFYAGLKARLTHDLTADVGAYASLSLQETLTVTTQKNFDADGVFVGNGVIDPNLRSQDNTAIEFSNRIRAGLTYETRLNLFPGMKNIAVSAYAVMPFESGASGITNIIGYEQAIFGAGVSATIESYASKVCTSTIKRQKVMFGGDGK